MIQGLLIVAALYVGLPPLALLHATLFPALMARAVANVERRPLRSLGVGLVNLLFFGLVSVALLAGPEPVRLVGLVVITVGLALVVAGIAAVAHLVGRRLRPADGPARHVLVGALTLELAELTPVVGWFLLPLLVGLIGGGAVILALVWRAAPAEPVAIAGGVSDESG